jgi:hypothetical protein
VAIAFPAAEGAGCAEEVGELAVGCDDGAEGEGDVDVSAAALVVGAGAAAVDGAGVAAGGGVEGAGVGGGTCTAGSGAGGCDTCFVSSFLQPLNDISNATPNATELRTRLGDVDCSFRHRLIIMTPPVV